MPGYDAGTKEIIRNVRGQRLSGPLPNLYSREAPGADPDDAAAAVRAAGGVPDDRLVGDVAGAAAHLRAMPESNGRVATIGYCSGGRQSLLVGLQPRARRRRRLLRRLRHRADSRGPQPQGRAPRPPARRPVVPAPRAVRGRGQVPGAGGGRRARAAARGGGQGVGVPHLRGGGARLLRHRPTELPSRGGHRGLAAHLGVLRTDPFRWVRASGPHVHRTIVYGTAGHRTAEEEDHMCTYRTTTLTIEGSGKGAGRVVPADRRPRSTSTIPCMRPPTTRSTST